MEITDIFHTTDWQKKWAAPNYSILSSSLMVKGYTELALKRFKSGLLHNLFIYRDGVIVCYQSRQENMEFGSMIGTHITRDPVYALNLIKEINDETDKFYDRLGSLEHKPQFKAEDFLQLKSLYANYLPLFIAVNRSADYITGPSATKILQELEVVRIKTEPIYIDANTILIRKIKQLLNSQFADLLSYREIEEFFSTGKFPSPAQLRARYPVSGFYSFNGQEHILNQEEVLRFEQLVNNTLDATTGFIKGQSAYPGYAKGKARIILNPYNVKEFAEGDILITGMTRPEFLPFMKKAGAIITDVGGILSHAAIVARELKKPCIIATQTATQSFNEGDVIEVDANQGIAKKID